MATIDINDVLRVVAEWDMPDGTIAQLVWHYLVTSGNGDDPVDVLDDIHTNLVAAFANVAAAVSDLVEGSTIELYQYDFGNHQFDGVATRTNSSNDGLSAADMTSHGVACLVKLFTESARRQARKYLFGIVESSIEDGTFNAALVTNAALFGADLDDAVSAPLVTLTYGTFNVDPASPLYETFSKTTQTVQAEAISGYQRRRRPGTGI